MAKEFLHWNTDNVMERQLQIYFDNKSIELYSKNNKSSSNSKNIDIKLFVLKE